MGCLVTIILGIITIGAGYLITKHTTPKYVEEYERDSKYTTKYGTPEYAEQQESNRYGPQYDAAMHIGREAQRQADEAFEALQGGELEKAKRLYLALSELYPNEPLFHFNLGVTYLEQGTSLSIAVERFQTSVSLDSSDHQAWTNLGVALRRSGKSLDAIGSFHRAISLHPNAAQAYVNLGLTYHDIDSLHLAAEAFRSAIGIDGQLWQAYVGLGLALVDMILTDAAIDTLNAVLAGDASEIIKAEALFYKGNAFLRQGKSDLALQQWLECLSLRPAYLAPAANAAQALVFLGDPDSAIALLDRHASEYSDSSVVAFVYGRAYERKRDADRAKFFFRKAIRLDDTCVEAHNHLGIIFARTGDCTQAIRSFNKAIDLRPDYVDALFNLGLAHWQCQDPHMALAVWEAMYRIDMPDSVMKDLQRRTNQIMGFEE